jgi:hypothetical protein
MAMFTGAAHLTPAFNKPAGSAAPIQQMLGREYAIQAACYASSCISKPPNETFKRLPVWR